MVWFLPYGCQTKVLAPKASVRPFNRHVWEKPSRQLQTFFILHVHTEGSCIGDLPGNKIGSLAFHVAETSADIALTLINMPFEHYRLAAGVGASLLGRCVGEVMVTRVITVTNYS